jgi:hypothetical protein
VSVALASEEQARSSSPTSPAAAPEVRGTDMADALAAAVDRLRARAEAAPALEQEPDSPARAAAPALEQQPEQPAAVPRVVFRDQPGQRTAHKHSQSWFARRRIKRKQRRGL